MVGVWKPPPNYIRKTKNSLWNALICPSTKILRKTASLRKIFLKSANQLLSYGKRNKKTILSIAVVCHFEFKNYIRSCGRQRVQNVLLCTNFHQNQTIFRCNLTIFNMASAILNFQNVQFMSRDVYAMLYCLHVQNFTKIGQSAADLWPKNDSLIHTEQTKN